MIKAARFFAVFAFSLVLWGCSSSSSTPGTSSSSSSAAASSSSSSSSTTSQLPAAVSSQVVNMRFGSAQAGAPNNNDDVVEFTFSSSGLLMLDNVTFASTFTVDSSGPSPVYNWDNGTFRYELSILNDAIHEVNVFDSANAATFLGQFTPVVAVDVTLIADRAGTYNVSATTTGTHSRGTVIINAQGDIDFDTGLNFPAASAQNFFDRSNLAVPLKRLVVDFGAFNSLSPNATVTLYLNDSGVIVRATLESEPNVTMVTDVDL